MKWGSRTYNKQIYGDGPPFSETMQACTSVQGDDKRGMGFNADSFPIGIDNHASRCMSPNKSDFIAGTLKKRRVHVKGIAPGHIQSSLVGTLHWRIQDDDGQTHIMDIPNSPLVPDLPLRLLSPQHLSQEWRKVGDTRDGTSIHTYGDRCVLKWDHGHYAKTVSFSPANVPVFQCAPSHRRYH